MISKKLYLTTLLATTVLFSACTPDLDTLENTNAQPGDAFTEALTNDYRTLAEEDKADAAYSQANMFARKGLGAAGGEMVQPIDPIKAHVPSQDVQELAHARSILAGLFAQRLDLKLPNEMAAAQVNFDCWVSELANNDPQSAATCKANFLNDLNQIQAALQSSQPELFMSFFNFGNAQIDAGGMQVLQAAAEDFLKSGKTQVLVLGYSDLVGTSAANIHISQLRANAGKAALIAYGVPANSILALGQGDSNPLVATEKENRENRRIEVILR